MKSRGLLSVLTFSEKRENLLFLLLNEPKTIAEIKGYLNVSTPEIFPRIKEMETKNLIYKENKYYALTPIGKVVAKFFQPLVNTLHVIEENEEFWKEHNIEAIPQCFLERIDELGNCRFIENRLEEMYEPHTEFFENISKSELVMGVAPVFNPAYPAFFLQLALHKVHVSLILTKNVFEKVKNEYRDDLQRFLECNNTSLYVLDDISLAFVVTDIFLSLSLFYKNGIFDAQRDLISFDESALKWGEELFNYYKEHSKEIKSL
ncbi:putative transcriptional regulator [Candidatus Methanoperedens nitroreducens]|uniref:Putative transcriptional regulator n=1 Tax=Candidatus Methanoperedens nitratireducens TaxID=1392998 RepID=A0A062V7M4_9EURY|nr:winged helix-turn-helix domain-containing protein [Candidatus Methanoperedens nitroreducens]KCZ71774.1 putative transcriptional regulator [Candidatus Methanoperedens nitroreducens]MDJ1422253.1 winged helix-turn-helix domain-containing protein [Candidatus Methanoperedens sp.]